MKIEAFDPVGTPLQKGISLIEASAGTGKTYTITMLVLRLVVELNISINQILVVTFTKAATEELKARIRSCLAAAKRLLNGDISINDTTISTWLSRLDLPPETIKQRLGLALLDIDQAGIFTIHGFCQRVLTEHALASGQLFDAELTEDIAAIKHACADDFWRRCIQNRTPWEAAILTKDFLGSDALLGSIAVVADEALVLPEPKNLDTVLTEMQQLATTAKNYINDYANQLRAVVGEKQFKGSYQQILLEHIDLVSDWLAGESLIFPGDEALALLTYDGLRAGLNGTQFKANQTQSSEERKADYIAELGINTQPFDALAVKAKEITVILRRNLTETMRTELDSQLEQINAWSFDNLISHLANALKSDQSVKLINELRQRFQAALIDEFQDTDNNQWHIFSSIFAADSHHLLMVGDPKQAIYKFRGADIYSYLNAQIQAQHRYTLAKNWRSHPNLVAAVNCLFKKQNAFLLPNIDFISSKPALTEQDGALIQSGTACHPMVLWQLPESDGKLGHWQSGNAAQIIQIAVVNEIVGLLSDDYAITIEKDARSRKVLPQDIAILVRNNEQAREYQQILRSAAVPSVLNSTESVFKSDEASHLFTLLEAIAHPGDINFLGQALALGWFGYDGHGLYQLLNDETEIDNYLTRFLGYYQLWQQKGVIAMMQSLLQQEAIVPVIAKSDKAERCLTNMHHTLELLQHAVIEQRLGIHKTLSWLKTEIAAAKDRPTSSEQQQLRMESDADAVTIITTHRAKGLEYPIVFCPYLWQSSRNINKKNPLVQCHLPDAINKKTNRLIVDLGSSEIEHHQAQAQFEDQAEAIRLAYVALTRAKYRCYVAWANVRSEEKPNESALAWLLDFDETSFSEQQTTLQTLTAANGNAFSYRLLEIDESINRRYSLLERSTQLSARSRRRPVYTNWQMSSYSALSSLGLSEAPEMPIDKAGETDNQIAVAENVLPAGAQTGNVVHELLENIPFSDLANQLDISEARGKSCQRFGLKLEQPALINELLFRTVTTPLSNSDASFCLMNIQDNQCLKEMPFYLSMSAFNTHQLNEILKNEATFKPLSYKQMSGFLTGFIDLICEYDGRFYVMDYKTNSLPDYGNPGLIHAMRDHNYGLQFWIYCVVLHRYLTHRHKDYRFVDHFGGVRYLFVRGMKPDIPMSGVFAAEPDLEALTALSALFGK